jgi:hypothetical protein
MTRGKWPDGLKMAEAMREGRAALLLAMGLHNAEPLIRFGILQTLYESRRPANLDLLDDRIGPQSEMESWLRTGGEAGPSFELSHLSSRVAVR